MYMGRFEESVAKFKRAQEIDQLSPIVTVEQGLPYYYSRQYKRAEEEFRQAQKPEPRFTPLVYMLAWLYEEEGKFEEAIALFQAAMAGYQTSPRMTASLARVYAISRRRFEARRLLKEELAYAAAGDRRPTTSRKSTPAWTRRTRRSRGSPGLAKNGTSKS